MNLFIFCLPCRTNPYFITLDRKYSLFRLYSVRSGAIYVTNSLISENLHIKFLKGNPPICHRTPKVVFYPSENNTRHHLNPVFAGT